MVSLPQKAPLPSTSNAQKSKKFYSTTPLLPKSFNKNYPNPLHHLT